MCNVDGSSSESCNVTTGECSCNEGVQGLNCDECKLEYYNFTKNGCQGTRNSYHILKYFCVPKFCKFVLKFVALIFVT